MICKIGHDGRILQKTINNFEKKTRSINKNNNNTDKKQTITFLWIPKIGSKIKKEIRKLEFRVAFKRALT